MLPRRFYLATVHKSGAQIQPAGRAKTQRSIAHLVAALMLLIGAASVGRAAVCGTGSSRRVKK